VPVDFKDYYQVLGVARDADEATIQKAFRKLARLYHPDVAKNKKTAEAQFKEINEANEVLGDPEKRKKYDELGADWEEQQNHQKQPGRGFAGDSSGGSEFHFEGTGFSDFFEQDFGSRNRSREGYAGRESFVHEGTPFPQDGQDIVGDILVSLDEVMTGSVRTIKLQRTHPRTGEPSVQTLQVKIPPGVREAQMVRIAGKGQEGSGGGLPGSLYLRVAFSKHPEFQVRGANLYYDLDLAPWEAVVGAVVKIPTLDGRVSLKIPAGTRAGRAFRLRGKGLPSSKGSRGDLHAVVVIQVPSQSTPEEKALWEQLARVSRFDPRTDV
jgi:curved DNA-binding protein